MLIKSYFLRENVQTRVEITLDFLSCILFVFKIGLTLFSTY